jgi:hypothetical protein
MIKPNWHCYNLLILFIIVTRVIGEEGAKELNSGDDVTPATCEYQAFSYRSKKPTAPSALDLL